MYELRIKFVDGDYKEVRYITYKEILDDISEFIETGQVVWYQIFECIEFYKDKTNYPEWERKGDVIPQ